MQEIKKTFQEMVTEFHEAIDGLIGEKPQMLDKCHLKDRITWMNEEIAELEKADTLVDQIDALTDLLYFAVGFFVEMGVPSDVMFRIVHDANMRKVAKGVMLTEAGQIKKPDNWLPPESEIAMAISNILDDVKRQHDDGRGIDRCYKRLRHDRSEKGLSDIETY